MLKVTYYSPSQRKEIDLNSNGLYIQTADELRGHKYSHNIGYRSLSGVSNDARSIKLSVMATEPAQLDALRHAMDADLYANTPGLIKVGEYSTKVLCVGSEVNKITPMIKSVSLDVVMLNPYWEREHKTRFVPSSKDNLGIDYPYDLPFDFPASGATGGVNIDCPIPCDFKLIMYGKAVNPAVSIGNNTYTVNKTIKDRERVIIDTQAKTVTFIDSDANEIDIFGLGVRGDGKGSGNYCFEQLSPGTNSVGWNGEFGLEIIWYEKDTVIPWILS